MFRAPKACRPLRSRGASAIEYVVPLALIAVAGIITFQSLGASIKCKIASVISALNGGAEPACASQQTGPQLALNSPAPDNACPGGTCMIPGNCFVAGTLVMTESGLQPIETLRPGARVLARDDVDADSDEVVTAWKQVLRTFVSRAQSLVRLTISDAEGRVETLEVTPSHRLRVAERGWIAAGELLPGRDLLLSAGGQLLRLRAAQSIDGGVPVYNLEVEDFDTYFVGTLALWAHNNSCDRCSGTLDNLAETKCATQCKHSAELCKSCKKKLYTLCSACKQQKKPGKKEPLSPLAEITSQVKQPGEIQVAPPPSDQVPDKVHFIWVGPEGTSPIDNMPQAYKENIDKTAELNPNHQIMVWTNTPPANNPFPSNVQIVHIDLDTLLDKTFGDDADAKKTWRQHYDREGKIPNFAAQSDMARVLILHNEGGVYSDTDNVSTAPLPENLSAPRGILVGTAADSGAITNALLGAPPNSPAVKAFADDITRRLNQGFSGERNPQDYIDAVKAARAPGGDTRALNDVVNTLTGPLALTEVMQASAPTLLDGSKAADGVAFPPGAIKVNSAGSWLKGSDSTPCN
jgi:mannosyltransferase OCH1-like enzyme/Flp pilus assembly pilin Flp